MNYHYRCTDLQGATRRHLLSRSVLVAPCTRRNCNRALRYRGGVERSVRERSECRPRSYSVATCATTDGQRTKKRRSAAAPSTGRKRAHARACVSGRTRRRRRIPFVFAVRVLESLTRSVHARRPCACVGRRDSHTRTHARTVYFTDPSPPARARVRVPVASWVRTAQSPPTLARCQPPPPPKRVTYYNYNKLLLLFFVRFFSKFFHPHPFSRVHLP